VQTVQLREAKARLSALVKAAEAGESTVLTKNGRPVAKLVPIDEAPQPVPEKKMNFAEWLMSIPADIPIERDQTPVRVVEF
jgi:antitoxin Phd